MISETQVRDITGSTAYGTDGEKIGKVGQLFLDDQSGRPEFVTVNTGLFGTRETFVPIGDAELVGADLRLPYTKERVKDAPNVDADGGHLDPAEEEQLYAYYGRSTGTGTGTGTGTSLGAGLGTGTVAPTDQDTSRRDADDAMTRSEERLEVGTASQEVGRARLRKYVTTETETHTVPVTKERVVVESEPVTDANIDRALDGPEITEAEHEVVLHEEKPVIQKTTEPVERVRLGTESVVDEETVAGEVRKEHIEVEGEVDDRRL